MSEPFGAEETPQTNASELFDQAAREVFEAILAAVVEFGHVTVERKKASIHLVATSGFAGVHPRKSAVLLNVRTDVAIKSPRIRKIEQVSAKRFHNEMLISLPEQVDNEVVGWLRSAYQLAAG